MARVSVRETVDVDLDDPFLVEGLPGVGLVGKIATDHLIGELDMVHYADVRCDGLPRVALYDAGDPTVRQPVRLYATADGGLLALQSDVPVSPRAAEEFADCVTGFLAGENVTPLYLTGMAVEDRPAPPGLFGVATGDGVAHLDRAGVEPPTEAGVLSGPTGALLNEACAVGLDGVAFVVETDPQFPDPDGARVLVESAIEPVTGRAVAVDALVDQAEEIRRKREQLARRMKQAEEESSKAQPLRGFQ